MDASELLVLKKKRERVIVVDYSLLKGTEAPICWPDPSHKMGNRQEELEATTVQ